MIAIDRSTMVSGAKLLGYAVAAYVVVTLLTGGIALPTISLPSLDPVGWATSFGAVGLLVGVGGIYAVATRRGWRDDVRFVVQVIAIGLLAYIIGRWVGPMLWGVLP
jgi:hypothetical protein